MLSRIEQARVVYSKQHEKLFSATGSLRTFLYLFHAFLLLSVASN